MGLIVRSSRIHAAGCYATTDIPKGIRIVEYTGRRIAKDLADEIYENSPTTYLFGLTDDLVIDGHGIAMFINHGCEPNCETDETDGRVWIFALRDIKAGEELTYDYCLYDGEDDDPAPCHCGSAKCRGTMYSPEELKRRAKLAKQAKKAASKKNGRGLEKKTRSVRSK